MTLTSIDQNQLDNDLLEQRKRRILNVKYKIYLLVLLITGYAIRPFFVQELEKVRGISALRTIIESVLDAPREEKKEMFLTTNGEGGLRNDVVALDAQSEDIQKRIQQATSEQKVITWMDTKANADKILSCLNNDQCSTLPEALKKNLPLLRTYMIIDELKVKKMDFDQKLFLQNINEFLLKNSNGTTNGKLLSITFGEPKVISAKERVCKLPLTLRIEFEHKSRVLSFLRNVEKRVTFTSPIYYTIEAMNYDIVNYGTKQQVDVTMNAYFYQG